MSYFCNHLPEEIIEIDGVTYWAADADGALYFKGDLVVNLTTYKNVMGAMEIPGLSEHFEVDFEEIQIPWKDGSVPQVKPTFWKAFHQHVLDSEYTDVAIHCFAGHGRTGTMLAALMVAAGGWGAKESVDYLRDHYCKSVVETEIQCLLLQELDYLYNNVEPDSDNQIEPSKSYSKGSRGAWNSYWLRD